MKTASSRRAEPPDASRPAVLRDAEDIATGLLGAPYASLDARTQKVARHVAAGKHITRPVPNAPSAEPDRSARAADAVARFGGSWAFIGLFGMTMVVWVGLNAWLLGQRGGTFDPYPYILLNLFLSMLAAIQAPVILMSQNRQAQKDRANAEHDYEVNLKAELEIMLLHDKLDLLREGQWRELLDVQAEQLRLLEHLVRPKPPSTAPLPNVTPGEDHDQDPQARQQGSEKAQAGATGTGTGRRTRKPGARAAGDRSGRG